MSKRAIPLIVLGVCNIALIVVILVSVVTGWRIGSTPQADAVASQIPRQSITDTDRQTRTNSADNASGFNSESYYSDITTDEPTEFSSLSSEEGTVESFTDTSTQTASGVEYNIIGEPKPEDFAWVYDAAAGQLPSGIKYLGNNDITGEWKAEIFLGDIWDLVYVTINDDATVTIEPYSINRGNGWEDESSLPPMVFTGRYDNGHIICNGESGDIDFYVFYEDQGVQYAIGDFDALSGDRGTIGLTRP